MPSQKNETLLVGSRKSFFSTASLDIACSWDSLRVFACAASTQLSSRRTTPWNSKDWTAAPNQGTDGFKRYVALAALARNVHRLGAVLKERAALELMRQREPYRKAT